MTELQKVSCAFYVKYHPGEVTPDYLGALVSHVAAEIPRSIPTECIYLLLRRQPLLVIGGIGTSLLTAGLLMSRASTLALAPTSDSGDNWNSLLLRHWGSSL